MYLFKSDGTYCKQYCLKPGDGNLENHSAIEFPSRFNC